MQNKRSWRPSPKSRAYLHRASYNAAEIPEPLQYQMSIWWPLFPRTHLCFSEAFVEASLSYEILFPNSYWEVWGTERKLKATGSRLEFYWAVSPQDFKRGVEISPRWSSLFNAAGNYKSLRAAEMAQDSFLSVRIEAHNTKMVTQNTSPCCKTHCW